MLTPQTGCRFPLICLFLLTLSIKTVTANEASNLPYQQQKNVVYAEVHGVGLLLDIFTPQSQPNGLAIVDVASGAYHSDRGKIRDHKRAKMFDIFCSRGYTVFAVRPGSIKKFNGPEMLENLNRGILWVKEHAKEYQIDPNKLALLGASAGGHLACMAAVSANDPHAKTRVKAVGVFFPPTDLMNYGGLKIDIRGNDPLANSIRRLITPKGSETIAEDKLDELRTAFSPARLVKPGLPPFLFIHGTADFMVPIQQSRTMVAALEKANVPVTLIVKEGGGHPWPTIHEEVEKMANWIDEQLK
ncbi:prolyl oligopeptidase family serine peptidase [Gimesia aquarii]|uniref:Prolyl oligopeptidase family protein n=1 Tax=Gimesia aquarii TaxID=2527964 RepID=A0A517VNK8_9PLAN|nr:prolyl oligopeptidase family serine peptidase [Gimesia aquarii]QDT94595.1 Prolyl oligopeptidase family protein [Gimesia aquarii]